MQINRYRQIDRQKMQKNHIEDAQKQIEDADQHDVSKQNDPFDDSLFIACLQGSVNVNITTADYGITYPLK